MSNKINIVVIQAKALDLLSDSIDNFIEIIKKRKFKKNTIVVFHELSFYKYIAISKIKKYTNLSLELNSDVINKFIKICNLKKINLILPIYEKRQKKFHNSAIVISSNHRVIGTYRKEHLPDELCYHEKYFFSTYNNNKNVFDLGFCKIGIGICWDQWHPNIYKNLSKKEVDVIFFPTSIGTSYVQGETVTLRNEKKMWKMIIQSHSLMYNIPIVVANRIGVERSHDRKIRFWGNSFITNHSGEIVEYLNNKSGIIEYTIDIRDREIHQKKWGFDQ